MLRRWSAEMVQMLRNCHEKKNRVSRMKSRKRSAAMFDRAAGGNVISNMKSKDSQKRTECL